MSKALSIALVIVSLASSLCLAGEIGYVGTTTDSLMTSGTNTGKGSLCSEAECFFCHKGQSNNRLWA